MNTSSPIRTPSQTCILDRHLQVPAPQHGQSIIKATLPPELCCMIARHATVTPDAFDTSVEGLISEETESVLKQLQDSMATKLVSLVSKAFYSLVEEYLYEVSYTAKH